MPINGTITKTISKIDGNGKASTSALVSAIENAGNDKPIKGKKAKKK